MPHASTVTVTARSLAQEHRLLRSLRAAVEAAFGKATARSASGPDVVAARLDALRGPLGAHFDDEERAGLFEQIEECAPEHALACARLREEHRGLLRRLDLLRTAPPEARRAPTWARDVRSLLDDLNIHEARETDLLTQALDGSIGVGD